VIGVLSALPVINVANCCCAWILLGGALAAYLMQQDQAEPIGVGDGAVAGLLAGIVGTFVWLVLSLPISAVMAPLQTQMIQRALSNASTMAPEARAFLEGLSNGPAVSGIGLVFGFFVMLGLGTVFGMMGGLFGALIFRKNVPPPPPPAPPTGWAPPPLPTE
jgi:hypothetical protein